MGVKALFIEPGSPWENGYNESFNGKLRDELLNREISDTLLEAKVLIERRQRHYNPIRPHSALAYRPSAPEALLSCSHSKLERVSFVGVGHVSTFPIQRTFRDRRFRGSSLDRTRT